MTDLDLIAVGLAIERPEFARLAYEATGKPIFQEIADGRVGNEYKRFREWLAWRQGFNRVRPDGPIRDAVLHSLKERRNHELRMEAVADLMAGRTAPAIEAMQKLVEPAPKPLKAVS